MPGVQCDKDPLIEENRILREENQSLKEEIQNLKWGVHKIKDDDKATKFYTGLPSFSVFLWLYRLATESKNAYNDYFCVACKA